jgi:hypothetical protein
VSIITKFLNQDVGKLLKADVGSIATKVLKADVGEIVKGTGNVLKYDLTDLFSNADADVDKAADAADATPSMTTATSEAAPPIDAANIPVATAAVEAPAQKAVTESPTGSTALAPPRQKLTSSIVNRQTRPMPEGSDLLQLMPVTVGAFSRPANQAQGDIANDPVSLSYSSEHEALTLTLEACWDNDEAMEKMQRRLTTLDNVRMGDDGDWAVGIDASGVIFLWMRAQYYFEIVSPRGVSAVARFLGDYPY